MLVTAWRELRLVGCQCSAHGGGGCSDDSPMIIILYCSSTLSLSQLVYMCFAIYII